ncbi:hypothetical protein D9757_015271 [Collybiopsis confluens]|uniref:Uncharacterized protein n=1 Tax=Collybiopsis confluens TaxID=2823264 RepID=A0A8H5CLB0_9AGAR|nr:hypothetical protein D9757_015271 [Collybiopsis confluens]
MFSTGSPYSPFFMSGLLPSCTANSPVDGNEYLYEVDFRRRGSLPDTASPTASVAQFHKERSFLSLDLAGTGSLRAPSLHTLRSRPSLQSLPSQKPMPKYADALPELPPMISARASSALLPPTAIAGPSKPTLASNLKRNFSTTSTVSSSFRRLKRSDALARLEGRTKAAIASFKFGGIKEEPSSNFMSMSDDEEEEDSSDDVDEWDMNSGEDADFVDLGLDFTSPHRYSYSQSQNDEENILPISPSSRHHHPSYLSFFSTSTQSGLGRVRSTKSRRSNSSFGLTLRSQSEPLSHPRIHIQHSRTRSMFPAGAPTQQYTSFMDFDRPPTPASSSRRPRLRRLSTSAAKDVSASILIPQQKRKADDWLQWNSFIEISGVA